MKIELEKGKIDSIKIPKKILKEALTHPNYCSIDPTAANFENLEFVGDAVLDLLMSEWLYRKIDSKVGLLSRIRSILVQAESLAEIASSIGLEKHILTEPGYTVTQTDLEDCIESIFGAIYLSKGLDASSKIFYTLFSSKLEDILQLIDSEEGLQEILDLTVCENNPVNQLQEFCQKNKLELPIYSVVEKRGVEHEPEYVLQCSVQVEEVTFVAQGSGRNQKAARRNAAEEMVEKLSQTYYI